MSRTRDKSRRYFEITNGTRCKGLIRRICLELARNSHCRSKSYPELKCDRPPAKSL
jgi:hypothetical protein